MPVAHQPHRFEHILESKEQQNGRRHGQIRLLHAMFFLFILVISLVLIAPTQASLGFEFRPCSSNATHFCLVDLASRAITREIEPQSVLNLANLSIQAMTTRPSEAYSIDLLSNELVQLPSIDANASFHLVNLSHNKVAAVPTRWPSTLSTLDLSLNRLTSFDFSTMPPSLSNLSLRGNNLTEMELTKTTFPPSLIQLDISDNPQLVLRLDEDALARLVAANFSLVFALDSKKTTKGCTALARIGTQLVCLNLKPTSTTSIHQRSYSPGFLIAVLICTGIFLYGSTACFFTVRVWIASYEDDVRFRRGTICSSARLDD
ncbi:hypothetical protein Ae201684P_005294 [Aphanomyces euteiches]|uniref:Leucine-rich repeat-containing N-terminal plant-type domain-containing protein n=1 Tax=Aphanomyces euteiches TaxID=100861 RepID=A0A6G0X108_9STRA|nr:hypothetical protein Ae201684_009760 [Aphanomyces euteiches]KAH9085588.1 hypothetical protein Ae201684P_005294 [Aphanomyces euteiches]KAH9150373.1 hypothetical protein AeRB84_006763 [Aphanomyces euteiches]